MPNALKNHVNHTNIYTFILQSFDITALASGYVADDALYIDSSGADAITARYIRLQPTADAGLDAAIFGLRLELLGCVIEENLNRMYFNIINFAVYYIEYENSLLFLYNGKPINLQSIKQEKEKDMKTNI